MIIDRGYIGNIGALTGTLTGDQLDVVVTWPPFRSDHPDVQRRGTVQKGRYRGSVVEGRIVNGETYDVDFPTIRASWSGNGPTRCATLTSEGILVTADSGGPTYLLENGQKRQLPDQETVEALLAEGRRHERWSAEAVNRVPTGPDVPSRRQPTPLQIAQALANPAVPAPQFPAGFDPAITQLDPRGSPHYAPGLIGWVRYSMERSPSEGGDSISFYVWENRSQAEAFYQSQRLPDDVQPGGFSSPVSCWEPTQPASGVCLVLIENVVIQAGSAIRSDPPARHHERAIALARAASSHVQQILNNLRSPSEEHQFREDLRQHLPALHDKQDIDSFFGFGKRTRLYDGLQAVAVELCSNRTTYAESVEDMATTETLCASEKVANLAGLSAGFRDLIRASVEGSLTVLEFQEYSTGGKIVLGAVSVLADTALGENFSRDALRAVTVQVGGLVLGRFVTDYLAEQLTGTVFDKIDSEDTITGKAKDTVVTGANLGHGYGNEVDASIAFVYNPYTRYVIAQMRGVVHFTEGGDRQTSLLLYYKVGSDGLVVSGNRPTLLVCNMQSGCR